MTGSITMSDTVDSTQVDTRCSAAEGNEQVQRYGLANTASHFQELSSSFSDAHSVGRSKSLVKAKGCRVNASAASLSSIPSVAFSIWKKLQLTLTICECMFDPEQCSKAWLQAWASIVLYRQSLDNSKSSSTRTPSSTLSVLALLPSPLPLSSKTSHPPNTASPPHT